MRRAVHAGRQTRTLTAAIRCGAFVAHFVPRAAGAHTKGRRARRFAATLTVSTALSTAVAVTAFAYWTAGGTGPSQAVAASLTAPGPLQASTSTGGVTVTWRASGDLPSLTPRPTRDGYWVFRSSAPITAHRLGLGSAHLLTSGGCAAESTEGSTATSCTDTTAQPGKSYYFAAEAVYQNWVSPLSAASKVSVPSAETTTTLTSSATPSASGQTVVFTATISSAYLGTDLEGTVTFFEKAKGATSFTQIAGCSELSVDASSPARASCSTGGLTNASAPYTIKAAFVSTSKTFASSSGVERQRVDAAPVPTPTVAQTGTGSGTQPSIPRPTANGQPSLVQEGTGTSSAVTLGTTVTPGDALVVIVTPPPGSSGAVSSVHGGGVTWSAAEAQSGQASGGGQAEGPEIWYGLSSTGGTGTKTITVTLATAAVAATVVVSEWSDVHSLVAVTTLSQGPSGTTVHTGTDSSAVPGDLLIAGAAVNTAGSTSSPSSPFTKLANLPTGPGAWSYSAYDVDAATSAATASWDETSPTWSTVLAVFSSALPSQPGLPELAPPATATPLPAVTSMTPATGSAGTVVTIRGTGLASVAGVLFGTLPGTAFSETGTTITVTAPLQPAGTSVEVALLTGSGPPVPAGHFLVTSPSGSLSSTPPKTPPTPPATQPETGPAGT